MFEKVLRIQSDNLIQFSRDIQYNTNVKYLGILYFQKKIAH